MIKLTRLRLSSIPRTYDEKDLMSIEMESSSQSQILKPVETPRAQRVKNSYEKGDILVGKIQYICASAKFIKIKFWSPDTVFDF